MAGYILRRIGYGMLVMILVVVTISSIVFLSPVDPVRLTFGQRSDLATVRAKTELLGLNLPLHQQLFRYLRDISPMAVLHDTPETRRRHKFLKIIPLGNQKFLVLKWPYLRESYQSGRRVSQMLLEALPATLILSFVAMFFATLLGVTLGVWSSLHPQSTVDRTVTVLSVLGYSLPSYVVAMLLALIFGFYLSAWTGLNVQGSLFELNDFGEWQICWKNLILPALALGMRPVALIAQMTRSAMLEVWAQDYVRTAIAKGLPKRIVLWKHALRNALNPVISAVTSWLAGLLAGAFFVETVFNFKGIGSLTVSALLHFDLPVLLGSVLLSSGILIAINLITDILYTFADPRVQLK